MDFEIRRLETVGSKIGGELRGKALKSVLFALLGILIYISLRFDRYYALGAVAALAHDVLITLGIFSILNLELDLAIIAAFMTIVGYSLNDTIVVFDRIRENVKIHRKEDFFITVNKSVNQTLNRTIITSLTTFVVVLVLYLIGGEVIKYFAFALIIGVIVGTYSSIYVASPLMAFMEVRAQTRGGK
jgi:preprotein translocase subunit SecF